MEKLIKSIEGVHPGKYDLRRNENWMNSMTHIITTLSS